MIRKLPNSSMSGKSVEPVYGIDERNESDYHHDGFDDTHFDELESKKLEEYPCGNRTRCYQCESYGEKYHVLPSMASISLDAQIDKNGPE